MREDPLGVGLDLVEGPDLPECEKPGLERRDAVGGVDLVDAAHMEHPLQRSSTHIRELEIAALRIDLYRLRPQAAR